MEKRLQQQLEEQYSLWNGINKLYSKWAKERGLTYDSLFVLCAIYSAKGDCCQKEICEEWSMPKQTVNSILKNFEKKGYVCLGTDAKDRRNKTVRLTAEGQRYAAEIVGELDQVEIAAARRMGVKNMGLLVEVNRMFYSYFQEEMEQKP